MTISNSLVLILLLSALPLVLIEIFYPLIKYEFDIKWLIRLIFFSLSGISFTNFIVEYMAVDSHFSLFHYLHFNFVQSLPNLIQAFIGYLFITFFIYWWHRLRHSSDLLWRLFHQVHHSTYRIQTITAIYAHPLDFLGTTLVINFVIYLILGLENQAVFYTIFITSIFDFWEHSNVRTPKWLGYLVVRPEMHRIHHEQNKHSNNYGIPIWDILFGTYENSSREVSCGFISNKEKNVLGLLFFKKID